MQRCGQAPIRRLTGPLGRLRLMCLARSDIGRTQHPRPPAAHGMLLGTVALVTCGLVSTAQAEELTDATVNRLRNQVVVELAGDLAQDAAEGDRLTTVGDRLGTGSDSQAQLIFNDDSLVRVGQNSLFSFQPDRTFVLDDGVAAIVTPPGAGGAILRTPAAVAAVQGSFIAASSREDDRGRRVETFINFNATPLEISNLDGQVIATLLPGQVALVVDGVLIQIAEFDPVQALNSFPLLAELCRDAPSGECERVTLASASEDVQQEFWRSLLSDPPNRQEDFGDFLFEPEEDPVDPQPVDPPPIANPQPPEPPPEPPEPPVEPPTEPIDPQTPFDPTDPTVGPTGPGFTPGAPP